MKKNNFTLYPAIDIKNGKCVRLLKKFPTEGTAAMTPTGHAYLSVKALDGLKGPVRISHVITL